MTALEKFQEYTSHCPKQYPYNNKLRREHKATISKAMRKKARRRDIPISEVCRNV